MEGRIEGHIYQSQLLANGNFKHIHVSIDDVVWKINAQSSETLQEVLTTFSNVVALLLK